MCGGRRYVEISVPSSQFFCELKTTLKNEVVKLKKIFFDAFCKHR